MSSDLSCIPLSADQIQHNLGARTTSFDLQVLAECESTNTVLLEAPPADDARIPVVVAERQTAGRGRRGRSWLAWPGASLTFSTLWRFPPGAPMPAGLSLVAGLAVALALEKMGIEGVQLKWPNDVLIAGRKVAGILVEIQSGPGRGAPVAVVGIGVNLVVPEGVTIPDQPAVTGLASALGSTPDRNRVLALLLGELQDLFQLHGVAGFGALRGAWGQRHAHGGQAVRILGEGTVTEGICQGVDEAGALLLATSAGIRRIFSGEVSLRPVLSHAAQDGGAI